MDPATGAAAGGVKAPAKRPAWRTLLTVTSMVAATLVVALVVQAFVFQTFVIPTGSMEPTLMVGDRIVVQKLGYSVHRGAIVVFRRPPAEHCAGPVVPNLVKRVIGLPTETITIRDGTVFINGVQLAQPWLPATYRHTTRAAFGPYKIPKGDYFMMGDHRTDSCDSRTWGAVPGSSIVGTVVMRVWPLGRLHYF